MFILTIGRSRFRQNGTIGTFQKVCARNQSIYAFRSKNELKMSSQEESNAKLLLELKDNLFVRLPVPRKGVVCSNQSRVERIKHILENRVEYEVPWGPKVFIGSFQNESFFIASAPVGSGSGLMFAELYSAGAEFIVRYGSDDVKDPLPDEHDMVKIISEADNLYGFEMGSGMDSQECGQSIFASSTLINALKKESAARQFTIEERICHHLENYHALRTPWKFSEDRKRKLEEKLEFLKQKANRIGKKSSFDMETAVLFRVAMEFGTTTSFGSETPIKHAATILQTVNKENSKLGPYEGSNKDSAMKLEMQFIEFILKALSTC